MLGKPGAVIEDEVPVFGEETLQGVRKIVGLDQGRRFVGRSPDAGGGLLPVTAGERGPTLLQDHHLLVDPGLARAAGAGTEKLRAVVSRYIYRN